MIVLTEYKGLDIVNDATGDGGIALTDNFKELADRAAYQAATDPGTSDDSTKGFAAGNQWLNTATQVFWSCVDASSGAASWKTILKRSATALELTPNDSASHTSVAGKLGIGGSTPTARLEVQSTDTGDLARFFHASTLRSLVNYLGMQSWRVATAVAEIGVISIGTPSGCPGMTFYRYGSGGSWVDRFDIKNWGTFFSFGFNDDESGGQTLCIKANADGNNHGWVGIGTNSPTSPLDVVGEQFRLRTSKTPSSASDTGNQGDICWDADYVYVCVATNTWKRSALSTW